MKVAVVYNRDSRSVINLFGIPNREKYGRQAISKIVEALKGGGHQVIAVEGDKDLVDKLEEFMPRVMKGERPGMAFNLSYGIQGQARYTHVPGILEMVGIPYVGSGPLAHSLALDKVVAKMIFRQQGLPTPDFAVLEDPEFEPPPLTYPLILKPKNEAVSFGIRIVNDEVELRPAAATIFEKFSQPVLAEQYIEGREINVGLIGNQPVEAFAPAELAFGEGGPRIYTFEDKTATSGRRIEVVCPAALRPDLAERAQELAKRAFGALGCYDCARVDMRMDSEEKLHILEINSLPSLGERGSYVAAARQAGLEFDGLVNRLVEVASARYFGTPTPATVGVAEGGVGSQVLSFLTQRRDRMEKRVQAWTKITSRTADPVGVQAAVKEAERTLREIGMRQVPRLTDDRSVWTWETERGLSGGTLLVAHVDTPLDLDAPTTPFRRDPEWLYGEGVGSCRGPLVQLEFVLRSLRNLRKLRRSSLGVILYSDEGRDCRYSAPLIRASAGDARNVIVLRPGGSGDTAITERRGQRKYRLTVEGKPGRIGAPGTKGEVLRWTFGRIEEMASLSSRKDRLAISPVDVTIRAYPLYVPHRATLSLIMSYATVGAADEAESKMRGFLKHERYRSQLERISDRPPMRDRPESKALYAAVASVAERWEIPLVEQSSVWSSAAGLIPHTAGVVCGMGPVAVDLYTPQEALQRMSLLQRTLLLAEYLLDGAPS